MKKSTCAWLVVALTTPAWSQSLERGSRVRLELLEGERIVGNVLAADDRAVTLARKGRDGESFQVSRDRILLAETSQGRKGAWWRIWGGACVGAVAGFAVGSLFASGENTWEALYDHTNGAVIGSFVGGFGGFFLTPERWTTVPAKPAPVAILPVRGGVGARVTLRF